MKKNVPKLVIHRETLRNLVTGGQHAAEIQTQSPCRSIMDDCPSWGVTLCDCEWTDWPYDCLQPVPVTDTCAC